MIPILNSGDTKKSSKRDAVEENKKEKKNSNSNPDIFINII